MTKEDIIRMAREAGWSGIYTQWREPDGSPDWTLVKESLTVPVTMEQIERFAALVAAHEREACARLQYEIDQLKRENSILRSEFKIWLVNNNIENYDMSEDAAEEDAEKWLTHLVAHNEGAE